MRACVRYFGFDGTLCATHHAPFGSPSETRCADAGRIVNEPRTEAEQERTVSDLHPEGIIEASHDEDGTRVIDRLRLTGVSEAEQERTVSLDPWEKVALAMAHLSAGEDTAALELLRAALAQRDREAMSSIRAEMIRSGDIKAES